MSRKKMAKYNPDHFLILIRIPMAQFGTVFCDDFVIAHYRDGAWQTPSIEPVAPLQLHPAAHVLHYSSTCFEGFKAYRWDDGKARIFRNADTGWGWPPYFKFDSGNLLAQANNLAAEDPPPLVLVRYYGFRIPLFSMVPNAVSMRTLEPGEDPLPLFNLAFGTAHAALVVWLVLRIRRWRRAAPENAST